MAKKYIYMEGRWEERPVRFWWEVCISCLVIGLVVGFIITWFINNWVDKLLILRICISVGLLCGIGFGLFETDGRPKEWIWVRKEE